MEHQSKERNRQKNTQNQESSKRFASDNHVMKKRVPAKSLQRENDIYITNKTNFVAQLKKCEEILNSETGEVFLHSIGLAINRGINLALKLQQDSNGAIGIEANTSTIELVDDFHPLRDEDDFSVQGRKNSCLHIRVYRFTKLLKSVALPNTSANSSVKPN